MPSPLQQLLQRPDVWRSRERRSASRNGGMQSGYAALDEALHGGWPQSALTELLVAQHGCGEVQLLLPLLAQLGAQQLWQFWINPPFIPYAPALAQHGIDLNTLVVVQTDARQSLWACEQALRNDASGAVLYWPSEKLRYAELRKLQVAAAAEQCSGFILRHDARAELETSPAALRLQLRAENSGALAVTILKQRGGNSGQTVTIERPASLQLISSLRTTATPSLEASSSLPTPVRLQATQRVDLFDIAIAAPTTAHTPPSRLSSVLLQ